MSDARRRGGGRAAIRLVLLLALLLFAFLLLLVAARNYIEVSEVELPDLLGMPFTEAEVLLARYDITPVSYEENIRIAEPGEITSQAPRPGTTVRRGRTVSLGVHTPPGGARAPVLIGLTAEEALAQARSESLNLGRIEYEDNDAPAGIVISQTPEPGSSVDPDAGLQVVVSRGPELPPVTMPDVKGQALDAAEQRLRSLGFISIGRVASGTTRGTPGLVTSQEPDAGRQVDRGTPVFLGYDLAADVVVQVPPLGGMHANTARVQLQRSGLAVGGVEYDDDPAAPAGTVLGSVPAAGTYTLNGTPVKIIVNGQPGSVALDPVDDRPPADETAAGRTDLFPQDDLGGRDVPFSFDPASQGIPALLERRYDLRLVVEDERGERTVLDRDMPAGEGVETGVTVYGDALLRMYINDVFFMAWRP